MSRAPAPVELAPFDVLLSTLPPGLTPDPPTQGEHKDRPCRAASVCQTSRSTWPDADRAKRMCYADPMSWSTQDKNIKTTKSKEPALRAPIRQISCLPEGIFLSSVGLGLGAPCRNPGDNGD